MERVMDSCSTAYEFPAKVDEIANICETVTEVAKEKGMSEKCLWKLETSIDEACTNISCYGYENKNDGRIWLKWEHKDDEFAVIIEDTGKPFDQTEPTDPNFDAALCERKPGGLGRFIMRQFLDEMTYERVNNKNRLTLIKKLSEPCEDQSVSSA